MGPMTGRGAGYCAGYEAPGYSNAWPRMGMGWGRGWGGGGLGAGWGAGWGRGRGWRRGYHATGMPYWARYGYGPAMAAPPAEYGPYGAPPAPEQEVDYLRSQAEWLRDTLEAITSRIDELEEQEE